MHRLREATADVCFLENADALIASSELAAATVLSPEMPVETH